MKEGRTMPNKGRRRWRRIVGKVRGCGCTAVVRQARRRGRKEAEVEEEGKVSGCLGEDEEERGGGEGHGHRLLCYRCL